MVEIKARGGTRPAVRQRRPLVVKVDAEQHEALTRWAIAEDRSVAALVRMILGDSIPPEHLTAPTPKA